MVCGTTVVAFAFAHKVKEAAVNFGEQAIQAAPAAAAAVMVLCQALAEVGKVFVKAMTGRADTVALVAPTLIRVIPCQINGEWFFLAVIGVCIGVLSVKTQKESHGGT